MKKDDINLRKEHEAVRNNVGFYDFTHQLLEVTGKDARKFLDKMFINSIRDARPGTAKYTTMLNEDGIIIDDVIVFCLEEERFWVSTLFIEEMKKWFKDHLNNEEIYFKDITSETSMWAVQGPDSRKVLNDILNKDISDLQFFHIIDAKIDDVLVKISRSGFTGELGYEIYFNPKDKDVIEKNLLEKGRPYDILELKSDVILMSLPAEKGYVIMDDLKGTNPLESGFGWSIDWDKDFIGKDALKKVKEQGRKRRLLGFTVEDDNVDIKQDSIVKADNVEVGRVTKATYGYTVEKNIGYVLVDNKYAKVGNKVVIVNGNEEIEATLTKRMFYDPEDKKVRG